MELNLHTLQEAPQMFLAAESHISLVHAFSFIRVTLFTPLLEDGYLNLVALTHAISN